MNKVRLSLIIVLLAFFVQEAGFTYPCNYESFIEYSTEKEETKEEWIHHNLVKAETKRVVTKEYRQIPKFYSYPESLSTPIKLSVNRTILYRTFLI